MIATTTGRLLGQLEIEMAAPAYDPQREPWPSVGYRPKDIVLDNDGCWRHWLAPNEPEPYTIDRDESGWVVNNPRWMTNHVYRLGVAGGNKQRTDRLPMSDGTTFQLNPERSYRIHQAFDSETVAFQLYELS